MLPRNKLQYSTIVNQLLRRGSQTSLKQAPLQCLAKRNICDSTYATHDNHWVEEEEETVIQQPSSIHQEKVDHAKDAGVKRKDHNGLIQEGLDMDKKERKQAMAELEKYSSDLDTASWMRSEIEDKIEETVRNSYPSRRNSQKREKVEENLEAKLNREEHHQHPL